MALLTALAATGFSYLFLWPTLAVAAALYLPHKKYWQALTRFGVVAFVTIVVLTPAVDIFLQFANPRPGNPDSDLAPAIFLPVGLALLAIGLLQRYWPRSQPTVD